MMRYEKIMYFFKLALRNIGCTFKIKRSCIYYTKKTNRNNVNIYVLSSYVYVKITKRHASCYCFIRREEI